MVLTEGNIQFRIMFMNYRVKKIAMTKFIHMKNSYFFTDITWIAI